MSFTALTNFIRVTDANGTVKYRYQNGAIHERITFRNEGYTYLPFVYQGAAKTRTGDNLEAALVMSTNWLAQGIAQKAVVNNWRVEVSTCVMKPDFSSSSRQLTVEHWIVSTMAYDETTVELILGSGIDAVGANAPFRTLRAADVGRLPVTGSVQNR